MERFFDIALSGLALIVLAPIFVPIIAVLKFSGEGEIFFTQERVGQYGAVFRLYKFATMLKNSPNIGTGTITVKEDPRILPFGRFLRKTKINELPQLLNIFVGDMSIIGPRPLTAQSFNAYELNTREIIKRVRPGLSGIGSIIFRGEEEIMNDPKTSLSFYKNIIAPYKGSLEEWFVMNKGIKVYFYAISLTLLVVINPKSSLPWKVFERLPKPPKELEAVLNYKG